MTTRELMDLLCPLRNGWRVFAFDGAADFLIWEPSSETLVRVPRFVVTALASAQQSRLSEALREVGMR